MKLLKYVSGICVVASCAFAIYGLLDKDLVLFVAGTLNSVACICLFELAEEYSRL
jgi:hypothetical protein